MTALQRIALNAVTTYGRSLLALLCGLFATRWTLAALGETDYGICAAVCGVTAVLSFLTSLLAGGTERFLGVSRSSPLECRRYFTVALQLHAVAALLLLAGGYPLGNWAVTDFLSLPPERVDDALLVMRLTLGVCVVNLLAVPFAALYAARQQLAEASVYWMLQTVLNVIFVGFAAAHPGDWLVRYAAWTSAIACLPPLFLVVGALRFPEARPLKAALGDCRAAGQLAAFVGWQAIGVFNAVLKTQGLQVLVSRVFGAAQVTAVALGNSVSIHVGSLPWALNDAFAPALFNAYGAGKLDEFRALAFASCKFATLAYCVFAVPLALELDFVLELWLGAGQVPAALAVLVHAALVAVAFDLLTAAHLTAVNATGRIAAFQVVLGFVYACTLPAAYLCARRWGLAGVAVSVAAVTVVGDLGRLPFARRLAGLEVTPWLRRIFLPSLLVAAVGYEAGALVRFGGLPAGWRRLALTVLTVEAVVLPLAWFGALTAAERKRMRGLLWRK